VAVRGPFTVYGGPHFEVLTKKKVFGDSGLYLETTPVLEAAPPHKRRPMFIGESYDN